MRILSTVRTENLNAIALGVDTPITGDEFALPRIPRGFEVSNVFAVLDGGTSPSVNFTVRFGTNRNGSGSTEIVTGGSTVTSQTTGQSFSPNNTTIPAGSIVWLEITSSTTGTAQPGEIAVVVEGRWL